MNLKLKLIAFAGVMLFVSTNLKAQTTTPAPTTTPSHLAAAQQMLAAIGIDKQFTSIVNNQIEAGSTQLPADKQDAFKKAMRTFMDKYFTWDLLKDKISALYVNEFTEDELKQITAFYNTPVGQKVSQDLPSLMQKGMLIGQEVITAHQGELQQLMAEALSDKTDPPVVNKQVSPGAKKPAPKAATKH